MELPVKWYFDTLQYNFNQNIFNVSLLKSSGFNHFQNLTLATWAKKNSVTKEHSFLIPEHFTSSTRHTLFHSPVTKVHEICITTQSYVDTHIQSGDEHLH